MLSFSRAFLQKIKMKYDIVQILKLKSDIHDYHIFPSFPFDFCFFFLLLNTFSNVMALTFIKEKQYRISKREIVERLIEN